MNLAAYTTQELLTIATRIFERTCRDLAGGLSFGLDMLSFRDLYPRRAEVFQACRAEVVRRERSGE